MSKRTELVPVYKLRPGDNIVDPRSGIRVVVKSVEEKENHYEVWYHPVNGMLGVMSRKSRKFTRWREETYE